MYQLYIKYKVKYRTFTQLNSFFLNYTLDWLPICVVAIAVHSIFNHRYLWLHSNLTITNFIGTFWYDLLRNLYFVHICEKRFHVFVFVKFLHFKNVLKFYFKEVFSSMLVLTHPVAYTENLVHAEPLALNSPTFTLQVFWLRWNSNDHITIYEQFTIKQTILSFRCCFIRRDAQISTQMRQRPQQEKFVMQMRQIKTE